ncbi:hypothetical protein TWF192_007804 [Orbilia oligospora]|uniref:Sister chromatid cohesion protein DCC1 n=1 Tax=Orbilia oligospora TaxID=2813651 RepID=A0A6G1M3G1_ORBOL|nr:hypothetical protein TWF679_001399 [Orbilia oligospora]KAF3218724.1 hypothetical protein TWF191_008169 [Orbilia oligospora]KAF3244243.1 hypothetical protein TWF192_007804 [Orbilia oligospora]
MSTQDDSKAIPLAFAHEQTPVRLLELPPSLLSLIENSTFPSSAPVLKIKAPPKPIDNGPNTTSTGPAPFAVLTTATETYNIRSVHSSNSIFILKPVPIPIIPDQDDVDSDTEMVDDPIITSKPGMIVTSTCASHLELLPSKPNTELLLQSALPEYKSFESPPDRPSEPLSKSQTLLNTPVSDAEFHEGWRDVTAFEIDNWALRLSPSTALQIFEVLISLILSRGQAEEIDKDEMGMLFFNQLVEQDGDLEYPPDAIRAVIRGAFESKKTEDGSLVYSYDTPYTTKWVGKHILLSNPNKSFTEREFMEAWRSKAPDECEKFVDLKLLEGLHTRSVLGVIRYIHSTDSEGGVAPANKKKNKWHEKFAAGKKR